MIAVLFEARLAPGQRDAYLDLAAALRPVLDTIDGFISIERFVSLSDDIRLLSLSYWRDEAAVVSWRRHATHEAAQRMGRAGIFADYRLRVASVIRDYGAFDRAQAPAGMQRSQDVAASRLRSPRLNPSGVQP